jgi:hypothetical protein
VNALNARISLSVVVNAVAKSIDDALSFTTSRCVDMISCDSNKRRFPLNGCALSFIEDETLPLSINENFSGGGATGGTVA